MKINTHNTDAILTEIIVLSATYDYHTLIFSQRMCRLGGYDCYYYYYMIAIMIMLVLVDPK